MSIGFVIVTYNSESVLPACLKSIPSGYEAVVVDNASKDKSAQIARSLGARVIVNKTNIGFGAACNRGAKLLSASHVFFLNPDAILVEGAVSRNRKGNRALSGRRRVRTCNRNSRQKTKIPQHLLSAISRPAK